MCRTGRTGSDTSANNSLDCTESHTEPKTPFDDPFCFSYHGTLDKQKGIMDVSEKSTDNTTPTLERFDQRCYLVRDALNTNEQIELFRDILHRCKNTNNATNTACMYPTPKTITFDGNNSTLRFGVQDNSVYDQIIQKVNHALLCYCQQECNKQDEMINILENAMSISMSAIRYHVPDGCFPDHIDHCSSKSWVCLLSMGCTANFVVKGPSMDEKRVFAFRSGDVLVFDASTKAAILHGVKNISTSTCPEELANVFGETLKNHRYGIQCRVKYTQHEAA